jgi:hypothetical protein
VHYVGHYTIAFQNARSFQHKIKYRVFCGVVEHEARLQADARCLLDKAALPGDVIKIQPVYRRLVLLAFTLIFMNDTLGHIYAFMVLRCYYRGVYYCGLLGYDVV